MSTNPKSKLIDYKTLLKNAKIPINTTTLNASLLPKKTFATSAAALKYAEKIKNKLLKPATINVNDIHTLLVACILFARGKLVCDLCESWNFDDAVLFETMRCILTSKFLMALKEMHRKQWAAVQPLYTTLFETLYEDILPSTPNIADVSMEAKSVCWK